MRAIKRILVIDDESTIRFLLKELIVDMGYEFVEASRAEKGLKIIEKEEIDLVFLDIQLPNMNGLEAIRKIRELDKNVPVVMVTAFHNIEEVVNNMEVSVQGFIQKPFDLVELRTKILDLLSGEEK